MVPSLRVAVLSYRHRPTLNFKLNCNLWTFRRYFLIRFGWRKEMIGEKVTSENHGIPVPRRRNGTCPSSMKMSSGSHHYHHGAREENNARLYEEAIKKLNTLQSNAAVLVQARKTDRYKSNIPNVTMFLQRAGITLDRIDELSIIHVSGTKGKGSVCAFCESMLRASGLRTGFFSSPHLVEVRERIRIGGTPLSKEKFAKYFFNVYNRLEETKASHGGTMPAYFRFLTIMAFHVFLEEKIDVVVMEVGIGGSYDCTNVIRKPTVVGIASLGLDHINVLGDTIEKIAWHKAAISKPGRPAFTVQQPDGAMKVVMETALECGASSIKCVPDLSSYGCRGATPQLGLQGKHQYINASLALQLCKTAIQRHDEEHGGVTEFTANEAAYPTNSQSTDDGPEMAESFTIPPNLIKGLRDCYWPGRNQTVKRTNVTYYIDGAHTPRSIMACQDWFVTAAEEEAWILDRPIKRILLFNSTGSRDEYSLLRPLIGCQFDGATFCPNITGKSLAGNSPDQTSVLATTESQMVCCQRNLVAFKHLSAEEAQTGLLTIQDVARNPSTDWHSQVQRNGFSSMRDLEKSLSNLASSPVARTVNAAIEPAMHQADSPEVVPATTAIFTNISDSLDWIVAWVDSDQCDNTLVTLPNSETPPDSGTSRHPVHIQVLVTGSLHLVGGVIKLLDPELVNRPGY